MIILYHPVISLQQKIKKLVAYFRSIPQTIVIKRTTTADAGFQLLVSLLDHELWNELKENQAAYDPYNKVPKIKTALLIYANEKPVACGCFKEYDTDTVEIKRRFVQKA